MGEVRSMPSRCRSSKIPMYEVLLSDLSMPRDVHVLYCHTKAKAMEHVRSLNTAIIEKMGQPRPGRPVPLYYLRRTADE